MTNLQYVVPILLAQHYLSCTYSKLRFLVKCSGLSYILHIIISPVPFIYSYIMIRNAHIYIFGLSSVY